MLFYEFCSCSAAAAAVRCVHNVLALVPYFVFRLVLVCVCYLQLGSGFGLRRGQGATL